MKPMRTRGRQMPGVVIRVTTQQRFRKAQQRAYLAQLADYLAALPPDYKHFDMHVYAGAVDEARLVQQVEEGRPVSLASEDLYIARGAGYCRTVACAMGHAPFAGIPVYIGGHGFNYEKTAKRVLGLDPCCSRDSQWHWCFSGIWAYVDNTPWGAAARIRYLLEHGVPKDYGAPDEEWLPLYAPQLDEIRKAHSHA